jgi:hypothetical protein
LTTARTQNLKWMSLCAPLARVGTLDASFNRLLRPV